MQQNETSAKAFNDTAEAFISDAATRVTKRARSPQAKAAWKRKLSKSMKESWKRKKAQEASVASDADHGAAGGPDPQRIEEVSQKLAAAIQDALLLIQSQAQEIYRLRGIVDAIVAATNKQ